MKTLVKFIRIAGMIAFSACFSHGGEVEKFIRETMEAQRAKNMGYEEKLIEDAKAKELGETPDFDVPKMNIFDSKDGERDARYYRYDDSGRLISVMYAATPSKNEYYSYDK